MHGVRIDPQAVMGRARVPACATALLSVALIVAPSLGCGGSSKRSGTGIAPAPTAEEGFAPGGSAKPKRDISQDARQEYTEAADFFKQRESSGWSEDDCESAAKKFANVASDHPKLIEARYMAGLAYQRCNMRDKAEEQYRTVLEANASHAPALSNLGEMAFEAKQVDVARDYWEKAVKADTKIVAARNNLAWLLLDQMRKTKDRSAWNKLEEQARNHLSAALAVNSELVKTYVLYGLVYLEGSERNRNRLDLAKLLLDEGAKRDDKFAPLYNARGLLQMKRNNQGEALANFEKAVALDDDFIEARLNVGNITLGFRKYDVAEQQFSKVLELHPDTYDAQVGLGIAQRGLGKLEDAEASYQKAMKLDANKGAAYFNLGVLYKDFRANAASDLNESMKAYETARDYFKTYMGKPDADDELKKEAKDNIADCDKIIKQLDEVIKAMAQDGGG